MSTQKRIVCMCVGVLIAAAAGAFQDKLMRKSTSKVVGNHADIQPAQPDDEKEKVYAAWKEEVRRRLGPDAEKEIDLGKESEDAKVQEVLDSMRFAKTTADVNKHNPPSLSEKQHDSDSMAANSTWMFNNCDHSPSTWSAWCDCATHSYQSSTDCQRVTDWSGMCYPSNAWWCSVHIYFTCWQSVCAQTGLQPCHHVLHAEVDDWCEANSWKLAWYHNLVENSSDPATLTDKSDESLKESLIDEAHPTQQESLEESLADKRSC